MYLFQDGVQLDDNSSNVSDAALVMSSEEANERLGEENKDSAKLLGCSIVRSELVDSPTSISMRLNTPSFVCASCFWWAITSRFKVSNLASAPRYHTTISQIISHSVRSTFRTCTSSWTVLQTGKSRISDLMLQRVEALLHLDFPTITHYIATKAAPPYIVPYSQQDASTTVWIGQCTSTNGYSARRIVSPYLLEYLKLI